MIEEGSNPTIHGLIRHLGKPQSYGLVYRFVNVLTLESMGEIEFLPAMHYR